MTGRQTTRYEPPGDVLQAALGSRDLARKALDALREAGWRLDWKPSPPARETTPEGQACAVCHVALNPTMQRDGMCSTCYRLVQER